MDSYDVALATMDDDGFGCAITVTPEREQPPYGVPLVRDENGAPVMQLIERDSAGRFITPRYGYVWAAVESRIAAFRNTPQPGSGYALGARPCGH